MTLLTEDEIAATVGRIDFLDTESTGRLLDRRNAQQIPGGIRQQAETIDEFDL